MYLVGMTEKGGNLDYSPIQLYYDGVRGSAVEVAWEDRLTKLGIDNKKTHDVIRRQAIRKTLQRSYVIL